ncbi:hypothetical protein CRE_23429 [Caenorhabditis remanei]|uniref:DUF38 domain-containing protein n=1 Tax=Caenorhabditis remanei TaxID=31234 RepID=E3MGQ9_CAERE|nr:hypothetical protein CRE_23429 [Caenorhabditis remanei]
MSLEPTLLSLPDVAKDHLIEYLNYIDMDTHELFHEKIKCPSSQNLSPFPELYLIMHQPHANIHSIQVSQNEESMELNLKAGLQEDLLKIEYKMAINGGCLIEANYQQGNARIVRTDGRNYLDVFCDDFTTLLKHQKSVSQELSFTALEAPEKRTEFWDMIRKVITDTEATTGRKLLLKKRSLTLQNIMTPDVFSILNYLDPTCIEKIDLTGEDGIMTPLDGIVQLPHWNHLEAVTLNYFFIRNFPQNISHLEWFYSDIIELTAEDVLQIKNMMLRSGQFQKNYVLSLHPNQDNSFQQSLGPIFREEELEEGVLRKT